MLPKVPRCLKQRVIALAPAAVSLALALTVPAVADDVALSGGSATVAPSLCSSANPFALVDELSGLVSPCSLQPGAFTFSTVYLQNASRVGGTALAAYPQVDTRFGLVPRLQLTLDLPSEIAESLPHGRGGYPITQLGYGASYTVAQSAHAATAVITQVLPPDSRFAPTHAQVSYLLGVSTDVAVTQAWTLGLQATSTSSQRAGLGLVYPSLALAANYTVSPTSQVVSDLGTRIFTRHGKAQSFSDVAFNHAISHKFVLTAGIGTTFNAVGNTKPHYLASGLTYRP